MKTIHKFKLEMAIQEIEIPKNARILNLTNFEELPAMYCEVDTDNAMEKRLFAIVWTGEELPEQERTYIGTFRMGNGLVYHVYELLQ